MQTGKSAGGLDDGPFLEVTACLREHYSGFRWESEVWGSQGRRRSPYRALLLFGLSPRTKDGLLVVMCRRIFRAFPTVQSFLEGQRRGQLDEMVRKGQRPFLESAAAVIERHGGRIPRSKDELLQIRGVGEKVAECVLAYGHGLDGLPLDANVLRVFRRLYSPAGLGERLEIGPLREWMKGVYRRQRPWMDSQGADLVDLHELFRLHGQTACARTPLCERCPLSGCPSRQRSWDAMVAQPTPPPGFWEEWRELLLEPLPASAAGEAVAVAAPGLEVEGISGSK